MENYNVATIKIFDGIIKFSIYGLIFLIPIFFTPFTSDVFEFNKQTLLVIFTFIPLFCWMMRVLVSGKADIALTKINIGMVGLLAAYILLNLFSVSPYGSFFGVAPNFTESTVSIICFFIVYFLVSNTFSKKEVAVSFLLIAISSAVVFLQSILQVFNVNILPFAFLNHRSFNMIGSSGGLALFAASLLPLYIVLSIKSRGKRKYFFFFNVLLIAIVLVVVNYSFLWWIVLATSALLMIVWILKRNIFNGRFIALPIFFLCIALFFITFHPYVKWLSFNAIETSLSHQMSFGIDQEALKVNPVFGSGPSTFAYDFAKYRNKSLNEGSLWNITFNVGSSKISTDLATIGLLGSGALWVLLACAIFCSIKYLVVRHSQDTESVAWVVGIMISIFAQMLGYYFYNSNISLDFLLFLFLGMLVVLITKDHKTFITHSSSFANLLVNVIFFSAVIFGSGLLLFCGYRYFADMSYNKGLQAFASNKKEEAIQDLKIAISNNSMVDAYVNTLATVSLLQSQDLSSNVDDGKHLDDSKKKQIEILVFNAMNAAQKAVQLEPNNVDNWSTKGYVCQSLMGFYPNAADCAIQSYERASFLNPTNPYLLLQQGNTYLLEATNRQDLQPADREKLLLKAKEKFNQAISLKENYSVAYIELALIARSQGNTKEELIALENAKKYYPNDASLAFQIGVAYYQKENWIKAEDEFKKALLIVPKYANALYYLGLTYEKEGLKKEAVDTFSALLDLDPNNQDVKKILENLQSRKPALDGFSQQPSVPQ